MHGSIPVPHGARLLAQAPRLRRARLPGRRRLHGPGQLGHRPRRRRAVRLHAAQRHPDLEPDGDPAAGARRSAGHRHRPRPRAGLPRPLLAAGRRIVLWVLCEIAIAACDLAEVIGSAIALNLLFGLPLIWGVCLTALDVLIVLLLQHQRLPLRRGARRRADRRRSAVCFAVELVAGAARPSARSCRGLRPDARRSSRNPTMLYIAIGILGATVMPHNLYLHSSIVQTRKYDATPRRQARGDPLRDHRFDGRADVRALHQRRHPDRGGGDVPRHAATRTSPRSATPTSC